MQGLAGREDTDGQLCPLSKACRMPGLALPSGQLGFGLRLCGKEALEGPIPLACCRALVCTLTSLYKDPGETPSAHLDLIYGKRKRKPGWEASQP